MIRKLWLFRFPVLILFSFLSVSAQAIQEKTNVNLGVVLKQDTKPLTRFEKEVQIIFQKASLERKRNPNLSIKYYQVIHDKAVMAHEPYFAGAAYYEISRIYIDRQLYFNAIEYSLSAYQIIVDNHLEEMANYFLIGIGNGYFHSGNYLIAEGYYRKAERIFIRGNDFHGIAVAENNIGLIKQKINQKDSALWYFQKALEQRKKVKVLANIGHSYYYLGTAYEALGDMKKARKYFEMAIPLLQLYFDDESLRQDYITTLADVYFELGKLSDMQDETREARANYRRALEIYDTIFERVRISDVYLAIGHSCVEKHDYQQALATYRKALQIADSANQQEIQKNCYEKMMQVFLQTRQNDSVAIYLKKYHQVTDNINSEMINSRFKEIQLALRIRQAENESMDLKQKNKFTFTFLLTVGILLLMLILISVIYIIKQSRNSKIAEDEIKARKVAEQDLEKLNLELKELNTGKDRFISILSHDLRSPFNALMGFADLLVEETADKDIPEIRHYSKMLQQISRSTFQLLENLLTWSRLQMGNIPFQPVPLQLYGEVSVVINTIMVQASRKSIQIHNQVHADVMVTADANMLQAILRNLISNAIKFTKPGGSVEVYCEANQGYYVIRVKDNGIGIAQNISEKLFHEADSMVSTNGTENEKGHGLGLLLCRYMVEKNGGTIWLDSTSVKGSTFAFTLPNAMI